MGVPGILLRHIPQIGLRGMRKENWASHPSLISIRTYREMSYTGYDEGRPRVRVARNKKDIPKGIRYSKQLFQGKSIVSYFNVNLSEQKKFYVELQSFLGHPDVDPEEVFETKGIPISCILLGLNPSVWDKRFGYDQFQPQRFDRANGMTLIQDFPLPARKGQLTHDFRKRVHTGGKLTFKLHSLFKAGKPVHTEEWLTKFSGNVKTYENLLGTLMREHRMGGSWKLREEKKFAFLNAKERPYYPSDKPFSFTDEFDSSFSFTIDEETNTRFNLLQGKTKKPKPGSKLTKEIYDLVMRQALEPKSVMEELDVPDEYFHEAHRLQRTGGKEEPDEIEISTLTALVIQYIDNMFPGSTYNKYKYKLNAPVRIDEPLTLKLRKERDNKLFVWIEDQSSNTNYEATLKTK